MKYITEMVKAIFLIKKSANCLKDLGFVQFVVL